MVTAEISDIRNRFWTRNGFITQHFALRGSTKLFQAALVLPGVLLERLSYKTRRENLSVYSVTRHLIREDLHTK